MEVEEEAKVYVTLYSECVYVYVCVCDKEKEPQTRSVRQLSAYNKLNTKLQIDVIPCRISSIESGSLSSK